MFYFSSGCLYDNLLLRFFPVSSPPSITVPVCYSCYAAVYGRERCVTKLKTAAVADYHGTGLKKNQCRVLDSGFHAVDSGFQILDSGCFVRGIWIPDCNR